MLREFTKVRDNAVFIVGPPRSGTSMLRGLFDGHPELVVFPNEMKFFRLVSNNPICAETFLDKSDFKLFFSVEEEKYRHDYDKIRNHLQRRLDESQSYRDVMLAVIEAYALVEPGDGQSKIAWVEKTPANTRYLPLLNNWFPSTAKFIALTRDPRNVFNSQRRKHPQRTAEVFCRDFAEIMLKIRIAKRHLGEQMTIIRYEDIIEDPERIMRELAQFLGVQFSPCMLRASLAGVEGFGSDWVPSSIESRSKDKRNYNVSDAEERAIESLLRTEMCRFGYARLQEEERISHWWDANHLRCKSNSLKTALRLSLEWRFPSKLAPIPDRRML